MRTELASLVIPITTGVVVVQCLANQRVRVLAIDAQSALPAGEGMKFTFTRNSQAFVHTSTAGGDGNQVDWSAFLGCFSPAAGSATIDCLSCALPNIWWDTDVQVSVQGTDATPISGSARLLYEVLTLPSVRIRSARPSPRKRRT